LLGFQSLDEQHVALADSLNELYRFLTSNGVQPNAGMDQLCQRLFRILGMTRQHFHDEEALMQRYGYPYQPEHHREHVMLLAEMQQYVREIEAGIKPFTLDSLRAFKYWQIEHVLYSDRKFANYMGNCLAAGKAPCCHPEPVELELKFDLARH
jgi:hemerythrin-like metal-binding protein